MQLQLNNRTDAVLIQSCVCDGEGRYRLRIGGVWQRENLIVTPQAAVRWAVAAAELGEADFEHLAGLGAEVVILGTGRRAVFPSPRLTAGLMRRHIGLEVMDTAAACRTYNILAADGRLVAAGLIM